MIIQSSNLTSSAGRYYSSHQEASTTTSQWDNSTGALSVKHISSMENYTETSGDFKNYLGQAGNQSNQDPSIMDQYQALKKTSNVSPLSTQLSELSKMRQKILDYLLNILMKKSYKKDYNNSLNSLSGQTTGTSSLGMGGNQTTCYFYQEQEMTTFETTGSVMTADGQTIDINISLSMTRSFMEYSQTSVDYGQPYFCDPLVINFAGDAAEVTDQKFLFDIDSDGDMDSISTLGKGSGFLALDSNEDGIINDGTELFGSQSGNGFADLAHYDTDQNGWIDEADEIFQKLKIWVMNDDGSSRLLSLKEAGIGAMYLGSQDSQFSLNNIGNVSNAMIRKTGLFLYENGSFGTLQQVDFAVSETA